MFPASPLWTGSPADWARIYWVRALEECDREGRAFCYLPGFSLMLWGR